MSHRGSAPRGTAQARAGPPPAGRGPRPAGDLPPPGPGPAYRPALRPRQDLAGARGAPLAHWPAQQARPLQALARPARRRRPRQLHPPVPRDPRPRLPRQLSRRPQVPRQPAPRQGPATAGAAHRPRRRGLAHPQARVPDRGRAAPPEGHPGPPPRAAGRLRPGPRVRHDAHRPDRPGSPAADRHRPRDRPAGHHGLREGTGARPRRRDQRPHPALELRPRRGQGRASHINAVNRQMLGRAGLPLLRNRVLLTAHSQPTPRPSAN
jgi:hypothetical protein